MNTIIFGRNPRASAQIKGSRDYPSIRGTMSFYETDAGIVVLTQVSGLPQESDMCRGGVFACHIHEGASCTGTDTDPFADAGTHYNPKGCPHPYHAGDMPPLFAAGAVAFSAFLTDRFNINEIIGKTVIIHSMPDDFTTQPSGNAGSKIACGVVRKM